MRFYGRGGSTQIASTVAEPMIALTICSIEFAAFPSTPPVFGSSIGAATGDGADIVGVLVPHGTGIIGMGVTIGVGPGLSRRKSGTSRS